MAITMDGIFVNGQKATFRPENILSGDASVYTEEIGTAVEEWLEENVTGGEQVTDTTLTLPGVPADSKKTGDEIGAVKNEVLYSTNDITQWGTRKGYGINSAGRYSTKTNSVGGYGQVGDGYSVPYIFKGSSVTVNAGYKGGVALWDTQPIVAGLSVEHRLEWDSTLSAGETYTFEHDGYLVFQCAYADDSAISEDIGAGDFAAAALAVNLYIKTVKDKIASIDSDSVGIAELVTRANTGINAVDEYLVWADNIVPIDGAVNGILNDDETITPSQSGAYYTSVYFPIKPNTTYINRTSGTIAHFYDYAKRPILILGISAKTFTTPANAVYARISSNVTRASWQINEGTELLEYSKGFVPYLNVGGGEESGESEEHSEYYHGPYDIMPCDFTSWYSGQQADYTVEGFSRTTTYAEVIAAFDALMALDPQYITKNALGTASGADAGGNAYTLYEYVFKSKNYNSSINTKKVPKIYMDGSIHGFEKCSTFGLYFFLKDLVTNWEKSHALEAIRRGVEIHVIPVSNPHGFDRNSYMNGNDVNINRNFDHPGEWIVIDSGSDKNGLAAFDQPESAIIRDWLLADEANVLCYMNLHTNGQWNASGYGEMNACMTSSDRHDAYFNRIFRAFCDHIEAQTLRWTNEHDSITPSSVQFCGKIQAATTDDSTKGTASAWANTMRKIVAMTLEGFNGVIYNGAQVIDLFSADAYKINSENIGNMVVQMLKHYAE